MQQHSKQIPLPQKNGHTGSYEDNAEDRVLSDFLQDLKKTLHIQGFALKQKIISRF
jgi:hypothetical protein